jgi:capsule polysaccharide export protein KpsE/RkpR
MQTDYGILKIDSSISTPYIDDIQSTSITSQYLETEKTIKTVSKGNKVNIFYTTKEISHYTQISFDVISRSIR